MGEVKQIFRPEFLNRVDEIIVFHALTEEEIDRIARLLVIRSARGQPSAASS